MIVNYAQTCISRLSEPPGASSSTPDDLVRLLPNLYKWVSFEFRPTIKAFRLFADHCPLALRAQWWFRGSRRGGFRSSPCSHRSGRPEVGLEIQARDHYSPLWSRGDPALVLSHSLHHHHRGEVWRQRGRRNGPSRTRYSPARKLEKRPPHVHDLTS